VGKHHHHKKNKLAKLNPYMQLKSHSSIPVITVWLPDVTSLIHKLYQIIHNYVHETKSSHLQ